MTININGATQIVRHPNGTVDQHPRNAISIALAAGEVVAWYLTGAQGRSVKDFCVVAKGQNEIAYFGHKDAYDGPPASVRISGTVGLGLLGATYVGKNGTAKLPGTMTSTVWDPVFNRGVDADDYSSELLFKAAGI
jgi:hypothetical protein